MRGGEAGGGVFLHRLHHDLRHAERNLIVDFLGRRGLVVDLHQRDGHGAVRHEGQAAGERLIQHHADGIDVRRKARLLPAGLLGADVIHGADGLLRRGERRIVRQFGDAEIRDLDFPVFLQNDILGLDVAMNHALTVRMLERAENLADVNAGLLPRERTFFIEVFLERDAVEVFHHDILHIGIDGDVVHADDVFMRKHRDGFGLVDETRLSLFVAVILVVEDFDGDDAVHHQVLRLQDERHAAHAQHFQYFIPPVEHLAYKAVVFIHRYGQSFLGITLRVSRVSKARR